MARPLRVNERATIASPVNRLRIDMRPPKNSTRGYVIKKKDPFTINGEYERNLKVVGEKSLLHSSTRRSTSCCAQLVGHPNRNPELLGQESEWHMFPQPQLPELTSFCPRQLP